MVEDKIKGMLSLDQGRYSFNLRTPSGERSEWVDSCDFYEVLASLGNYTNWMFIHYNNRERKIAGETTHLVSKIEMTVSCKLPWHQGRVLDLMVGNHNMIVQSLQREQTSSESG